LSSVIVVYTIQEETGCFLVPTTCWELGVEPWTLTRALDSNQSPGL